jgi:phospholipid/cholesterol/gamma-HCH transport system permease protein
VSDPIAAIGRSTARRLTRTGGLARFASEAVRAIPTLPGAGRPVAVRILLNQLRFTALEAVGLVVLLSGIFSFLVIRMAVRELGPINAYDLIGRLIVVIIVRELGPILTALAVVGRSGTAITAELATNTVLREVRALEGMGIDPYHYLVLPRLFGCIISVTVLIVLFDSVALASGFLAAGAEGMSGERYWGVVLASLTTSDVIVTFCKGILFGLVIGLWPSFHGLAVRRGPTEIPQAVIRATVGSIVMIFVVSALFVIIQ